MIPNNLTHVASFGQLLGICDNLGARYNPGNAAIMPSALGALHDRAQKVSKVVTDAQTTYTLAVNSRKEVFDALPSFVAQLVRSAMGHQVSAEHTRDLVLLKKKFYQKAKSKKPPATPDQLNPMVDKKVVRYKTFETKTAHFASVISIVESLPNFKPNEASMTVDAMKAKLEDLRSKSAAVTTAANALTSARLDRDQVFYGGAGIYPISRVVKEYVRSIAGIQSSVALAIGKVKFQPKRVK